MIIIYEDNIEYCVNDKNDIKTVKPFIDFINNNSDITNVFLVELINDNEAYCLCSLDAGEEYYDDDYWNNDISWELERLSDILLNDKNLHCVDCFASEEICNALYIEW